MKKPTTFFAVLPDSYIILSFLQQKCLNFLGHFLIYILILVLVEQMLPSVMRELLQEQDSGAHACFIFCLTTCFNLSGTKSHTL